MLGMGARSPGYELFDLGRPTKSIMRVLTYVKWPARDGTILGMRPHVIGEPYIRVFSYDKGPLVFAIVLLSLLR